MSDKISNLTNENFKSSVTSSATPVLVDFWAPWCGPCKAIAPILDDLSTELDGKVKFAKVNVDDNNEVAAEYNVRAIPTLIIFKGGAVVDTIIGRVSKDIIKSKLAAVA